jgi:hypothetical protein
MFYPGQPVFIKDDKLLAIFLGEDDKKQTKYEGARYGSSYYSRTDFYVLIFKPDEDPRYELTLAEYRDIQPLIRPCETNLTGQEIYYGPQEGDRYIFRKPHWHSVITDAEMNTNKLAYLDFLENLASEEWVLNKYLLDKELDTETK